MNSAIRPLLLPLCQRQLMCADDFNIALMLHLVGDCQFKNCAADIQSADLPVVQIPAGSAIKQIIEHTWIYWLQPG